MFGQKGRGGLDISSGKGLAAPLILIGGVGSFEIAVSYLV